MGYRLLGQNKLKEAMGFSIQPSKPNPKSAQHYDSLAEAYLGAGEKKLAVDFYKKALEVDPDYPTPLPPVNFSRSSKRSRTPLPESR